MDLVFLIDATASMASSIQGAHDKATTLARLVSQDSPDVDFQFGCICYRDPVDIPSDIHEVLGLSSTIDTLVKFLGGISASGGGDGPEDWVGAYDLALHEMNWRDGGKTIIHIADAPAHGLIWGGCGHEEEATKLSPLIEEVAKRRIVVTALDINSGAAMSFKRCKEIYDAVQGPGFDYQVFGAGRYRPWAPPALGTVTQSSAVVTKSFGPSLASFTITSESIGVQMCTQAQWVCQQALNDRY
jgi:hypothetical protein